MINSKEEDSQPITMIARDKISSSRVESGYVIVSTVFISFIKQYETMVFECDKDGYINNYFDLDCKHYDDESFAMQGHHKMIEEWRSNE